MKKFFATLCLVTIVVAVFATIFWDYFSLIPIDYWFKILVSVSATGAIIFVLIWLLDFVLSDGR